MKIMEKIKNEEKLSNVSNACFDQMWVTLKYLHSIRCFPSLRNEKRRCCYNINIYEMNFTLCVLLVYNDNGSVQTLCITRVSALCTKCLHRPIVIINQQYTKGEIHFIYLHYFHVFGFRFIDRYHGNGRFSPENPTECTVNGRA